MRNVKNQLVVQNFSHRNYMKKKEVEINQKIFIIKISFKRNKRLTQIITWVCCGIQSRKTRLGGHSRQWSTVYYASGSKGNQFPTRTLMFLRGPVLYPPLKWQPTPVFLLTCSLQYPHSWARFRPSSHPVFKTDGRLQGGVSPAFFILVPTE